MFLARCAVTSARVTDIPVEKITAPAISPTESVWWAMAAFWDLLDDSTDNLYGHPPTVSPAKSTNSFY